MTKRGLAEWIHYTGEKGVRMVMSRVARSVELGAGDGRRESRPRRAGVDTRKGAVRWTAWAMVSPWIIGFICFTIGPLVASVLLAFTNYHVFGRTRWVGLNNFLNAIHDPTFWNAWRVTLIYGGVGTVYTLALALSAALLLYHAKWAVGFWRALYFFPALLAGAAQGMIMVGVWDPQYGLVNGILKLVGIAGPPWLTSGRWALVAVVLMQYWTIGTMMLLFLGARYSVAPELYEVAHIDGASPWKRFRNVTLPMMSPIIVVNLILGLIGAFQAFSQVYIMTGGGPGDATELMGIFIYNQSFENLRLGFGAAVSLILFIVLVTIVALLLVFARGRVYYPSGDDLL